MATNTFVAGDTELSFNPLDVGLLVATVLMTIVMAGLGTLEIFGFDFADPVFHVSALPVDPSMAWLVAVISLVGTVITNDNTGLSELRGDIENLPQYYAGAVIGTAALLVGWILIPGLAAAIGGQDFFGLIFVALITTAQLVVGWML